MENTWKDYKVSVSVCFICAVVYLLGYQFPVFPFYSMLTFSGDLEFMKLQPFRYVTPIFLHFHILHIAFNLAIWWFFATQLEETWGPPFLILFVIVVGFSSNIAQFLVSGPRFGGLSGVDFGLVGYAWLYNKLSNTSVFKVPPGLMIQIFILLALGFSGILDKLIGPIANMAHLVGFLSGAFIALLMNIKHLQITK